MTWEQKGKYSQQTGDYRISAAKHGKTTAYTLWTKEEGTWRQVQSSESARELRRLALTARNPMP